MPHATASTMYTSHPVSDAATIAAEIDTRLRGSHDPAASAANIPSPTAAASPTTGAAAAAATDQNNQLVSEDLSSLFVKLKQHKSYSTLKSALQGSLGGIVLRKCNF
jgi:hypothetical protein